MTERFLLTTFPNLFSIFFLSVSFFDHSSVSSSAQIAQLVEHVLGKDEVAGSSPVLGSISLSLPVSFILSISVINTTCNFNFISQ